MVSRPPNTGEKTAEAARQGIGGAAFACRDGRRRRRGGVRL